MNKKIAVILSTVLCLSALTPFASAANSPVVDGKSIIVIKEGQDLVLKNVMVVPETGFVIVTEEVDKQDAGVVRDFSDTTTASACPSASAAAPAASPAPSMSPARRWPPMS